MEWVIKPLGELVTFERGLTYSKSDEAEYSSNGVLRSNNVDLETNSLNLGEIKYLNADFIIPSSKKVVRNSLLMCMSNGSKSHLGKVALIEDDLDYAFGGFMGLLKPIETVILPRYLYYSLISPAYKKHIQSLSDGANINNLKYKDLSVFPVMLPMSLSEQQRIVDILDAEFAKIDALKENTEKNLQNAKDLFQAVLRKELEPKEGWRQTSIGKVCVLKSGNSNANNSPVGSLPFVKVGDMNIKGNEEKITCSSNYVSYGENRKNIFPIGTIIFPKRGGAILTNKKRITAVEICCDLNIMGVYSLGEILPEYLYFHFLTVDLSKIYNGAAIPQINNGDISPLCISYPIEKKEQQKIIDKLILHKSNSMALHLNYEKTTALCNDMKQALLRKAFNGEM